LSEFGFEFGAMLPWFIGSNWAMTGSMAPMG